MTTPTDLLAFARSQAAAVEERNEVTAETPTDEDFRRLRVELLREMQGLDGAAWQAARDLYDECRRGRVYNSMSAREQVAAAINARRGAKP